MGCCSSDGKSTMVTFSVFAQQADSENTFAKMEPDYQPSLSIIEEETPGETLDITGGEDSLVPFKSQSFGEISDIELGCTIIGESLSKFLMAMEKEGIQDDVIPPLDGYTSQVADQIEGELPPSQGEYHGIMSWDICWLRGDDGNHPTDYHETMCIADRILSPNASTSEFKIFNSSRRDTRILKKTLADAYIEAVPTSRRKLNLVTIAVDSIWKEITNNSKGNLELREDLYMKELAWLLARKPSKRNIGKDSVKKSVKRSQSVPHNKKKSAKRSQSVPYNKT